MWFDGYTAVTYRPAYLYLNTKQSYVIDPPNI